MKYFNFKKLVDFHCKDRKTILAKFWLVLVDFYFKNLIPLCWKFMMHTIGRWQIFVCTKYRWCKSNLLNNLLASFFHSRCKFKFKFLWKFLTKTVINLERRKRYGFPHDRCWGLKSIVNHWCDTTKWARFVAWMPLFWPAAIFKCLRVAWLMAAEAGSPHLFVDTEAY